MNKTIKGAALKLPKECRESFIELFKLCNVMDLYGDCPIETYFEVILQVMTTRHEKYKKMTELIGQMTDLTDKIKDETR